MSERCFRLPLDFESRPWFRAMMSLATDNIGPANARYLCVWLAATVFRELGYAAEAGELGVIKHGQLRQALVDASEGGDRSLGWLVESGLLKVEGDQYRCDLFARLNPELDGSFVSVARQGGLARSVRMKMKAAAAAVLTESGQEELQGLFAELKFDATMANRSMMLVKAADNVYLRKARRAMEWTEGLLADAGRVLEKHYENGDVDRTLAWVLERRTGQRMAGVPTSTEELLRDFEKYVQS